MSRREGNLIILNASPGFGQPQQQQQQPSAFGGFGQPAQPTPFGAAAAGNPGMQSPSAFGTTQNAFGAAPAPAFGAAPQTSSVFGAASTAPSTGFGFGAALGGSAFGQKPATTGFGGFGAGTTGAGSAFGGGAPAFGAPAAPAATGFGAAPAAGMFGAAGVGAPTNSQMNNGTGNPQFQAPLDDETTVAPGTRPGSINAKGFLINICAMQAYKDWSQEELRWRDYELGKKYGGGGMAAGVTGFGGGFGSTTTAGGFGAPATSAFGMPAATTASGGLFGSTAAPAFGAQTQAPSFGFGQPATTQASGLFGATSQPANTGLFGQTTSAFGQPSTTSAFGQPASGFGAQQAKPAFGFGGEWLLHSGSKAGLRELNLLSIAPAASTSAFGSTPAFGQPTSTAGGGLFGAAPASTAGFGGFGSFPASTAAPTPFGQPAQTQGAFGGFGTSQPAQTGSLFGAPKPASSAATTGLFGAPAATQSIFGAQSQPQQTGSLVGGTSQASGGFGFGPQNALNTAASKPGILFGQSTGGGSLFGAQSAPGGGFGISTAPAGGSLFGGGLTTQPLGYNANLANMQQSANLRASIDRNPYGVNPIFESPAKKTEPSLLPVEEKKKAPVSPYVKVSAREASNIKLRKLRGFSPPRTAKSPSVTGASRYESAIGKSKDDGPIGLDPRFTPRKNVRRLIIEEPSENETSFSPAQTPIGKGKSSVARKGVTFNPSLETEASGYAGLNSGGSARRNGSPSPGPGSVPATPTPPSRKVNATPSPARSSGDGVKQPVKYVLSPSLKQLYQMETEELRAVSNFRISVADIGYIQWLEPVDLIEASPTGNRSGLDQIAGNIVILAPKLANVYPDDITKPPVGMGLNVRAEIALEKCWPVDKSTREFILDPTDPRHDRHMKKLENMPDTEFLGYHNETGTWKFVVQHFSKYGLDEDDEDDDPGAAQAVQRTRSSHNPEAANLASPQMYNNENPFFEQAQVGSYKGQTSLGSSSFNPRVSRTPSTSTPLKNQSYGLIEDDEDDSYEMDDASGEILQNDEEEDQQEEEFVEVSDENEEDDGSEKDEGATSAELAMKSFGARSAGAESVGRSRTMRHSPEPTEEHERDPESSSPHRKAHTVQQLEVAHGVQRMKSSLFASSAPPNLPQRPRTPAPAKRVVQFNLTDAQDAPVRSALQSNFGAAADRGTHKRGQTEEAETLDIDDDDTDTRIEARSGFETSRTANSQRGFGLHTPADASTIDANLPLNVQRSPKKYQRVNAKILPPYDSSITYGKERQLMDKGLMMGRGSRVGWGPGGVLVVIGTSLGKVSSFSNISIKRVNICGNLDEDKLEVEREKHTELLEVTLKHASIVKTVTGSEPIGAWQDDMDDGESQEGTPKLTVIPKASLDPHLNFASFVDLVTAVPVTNAFGQTRARTFSEEESMTWKLAQALWDPIDVPETGDHHTEALIESALRREEVSKWLRGTVKRQTDADVSQASGAERVFVLLGGRQVGGAITAAIQNRDLRLASILAQLGGPSSRVLTGKGSRDQPSASGHGIPGRHGTNEVVLKAVSDQLAVWEHVERNRMSGVTKPYMRLWNLVGGQPERWGKEIFERLPDWKRNFGLYFWYADGGAMPIHAAVGAYENGAEELSYVAQPAPAYLGTSRSSIPRDVESNKSPRDICFHLLKLFSQNDHLLESALNPLNITPNPLDHRVTWLLWVMLSTVKRVRTAADSRLQQIRFHQEACRDDDMDDDDSEDSEHQNEALSVATADRLTRDFMAQLEALGLWKWSIFVALFLGRKSGRERAVRECLARHYPLDDDSGSWVRSIAGKEPPSPDANSMDVDVQQPSAIEASKGSEIWRFLVDTLKIPELWIHEARALAAKYHGDPVQEAICLIDAQEYVVAHRVILAKIASQDILDEHYQELKSLLGKIPPDSIDKRSWSQGGKLLLAYIDIMNSVPWVLGQARDYS
ncbi:nuclear protein 96-domain-containing protein, partial [Fimicolochytrium jonesii]|uniref:nuclear protein 96-domain-containing protein n=1 Tax=Fimicolochytrium jonesii TaxID=1396493 RepID=UPI0022FEC8B3